MSPGYLPPPPPLPPFVAPACDRLTVLPATVTWPLRLPPFVLETVTVALPDPELAPAAVAHDSEDAEVHAQPAVVATDSVAVPPLDVKVSDVGVTE